MCPVPRIQLFGKETAAPAEHSGSEAGWQCCREGCFPSQIPVPEPGIAFPREIALAQTDVGSGFTGVFSELQKSLLAF